VTDEPNEAPADAIERKVRILLADDHAVVREGLAALLNRRPDLVVVGEAGDGDEAVELFRKLQPDLVLMDLRMPKRDGIEAIAAIRSEAKDARIVVLSNSAGDEDIFRALAAGAKAYLLKDSSRNEILDAIRAVLAGRRWIPPVVAAKLAERMPNVQLTPREHDVLVGIARGLSNKEIADTHGISEGTVKGHVNMLLAKLGVRDRTQAALAAIQRGLVHL